MELKDIIKTRRKELNLTLSDIAMACNVSEATVSRWESGDIGDMKRSRIAALSKTLKLSPSILVGTENEDEQIYKNVGIDYIRVPLYPPICCGNGMFIEDNILEYIPIPAKGMSNPDNYFCQIARGDSMIDAGISDGDLLIFEKTSTVNSGMIGCFCINDDQAVCKKYIIQNNIILLRPMNSEYDPIIVDPSNTCFKCVGKLKKSIKNFNIEKEFK